ncbi:hypothetical protein [Clostridium perfringens]|uniref:hypothetical protein n=1 Tax=Clostridium perfringens TaxID=1502 RepID=UPI002AC6DB2D|nr:hypothetical protein [Clostridium perfringens]MDZ4972823.1 hypothetical protein [Clostridium perfringens]
MYMGKISKADYMDSLMRIITMKELSMGIQADYKDRKKLREKLDKFIENELGQMLI